MKLNDILKGIALAGVFIVPFVPLVVSTSMFFPFITGKNFLFRVVVELMFVSWAFLAWRDAAFRVKRSLILVALAVFVGVIALADIFGENFYRSFWSNFERMEGLVALVHLFAYFVVASAMLRAGRLWERFFFTSFGVNAVVVGFSILQLAGTFQINQGGVRVDATFGNATYLAVYLVFHIFLAAFFLMRRPEETETGSWRSIFFLGGAGIGALFILKNLGATTSYYLGGVFIAAVAGAVLYFVLRLWNAKHILWIMLVADLFILYHTQTRGAILGLIGGVLIAVVLFVIGNWQERRVRNYALGALAAIVVFVSAFIALRDASFIRESPTLARFASISFTEQTTKSRFMVWDMSWQGFKERPLLGWGQDNFIVVFSKYYNPGMWNQEPWFDRSHNVFFDWMIAGGLLGILAYLGLFGSALYTLWRRTPFTWNQKAVLTGLFGGYFFQNLFVFDNLTSYIMFFSLLGFVATAETNTEGESAPVVAGVTRTDQAYMVFAPLALVLVVLSLYFANVKPIRASQKLIKAISPQSEGYAKNLEYFQKLFSLNTFGSGEAREQLVQVGVRLRNADPNAVPTELKQQFFTLTREQMLQQIERAPTDVRYELYLGSFLATYGAYDEAIEHLTKAIELSPHKQPILFELAIAYINSGQPEKALPYLERAYREAPQYTDAAYMYAAGLFYSGKDAEGDAFLKERFDTTLVNDVRVLSAYDFRKKYDRIIAVRLSELDASPDDPQILLALASAYLRAERRGDAIRTLERIIALNPSFKEQGEYYISEIRAGRNP